MTDDEKLALVNKTEGEQWEKWSRWDCKDLSVIGDSPDFSLIESCQRIRTGLESPSGDGLSWVKEKNKEEMLFINAGFSARIRGIFMQSHIPFNQIANMSDYAILSLRMMGIGGLADVRAVFPEHPTSSPGSPR